MFYTNGNYAAFSKPTKPKGIENRRAYIVGGGLAGLAAAAFLVRDGRMPGENITVLEELKLPGGGCDGIKDPKLGYITRGGREMEDHFECLWDLYRSVPSLKNEGQSVLDEFYYLNRDDPSGAPMRVTEKQGQDAHTLHKFGLTDKAALELAQFFMTPERELYGRQIEELFSEEFFASNFWLFFRTMFSFQTWHSALEMRRYLARYIHHAHNFTDLSCLKFTTYNQYESMILPLMKYLESFGVRFRYDTIVENVSFRKQDGHRRAEKLICTVAGAPEQIQLRPEDLVFITLGCNTEQSGYGDHLHPASVPDGIGPSWELWKNLAAQSGDFGHPQTFCGDTAHSNWVSATITCIDPEIPAYVRKVTGRDPYNGRLVTSGPVTVRDSSWLMSWAVSRQPHFAAQKPNEIVAWVYGLFSDREGDYVKKAMADCTGEEICMEWLYHMGVPVEKIPELARHHAVSIPCMMPYVTSYFMVRSEGDRPRIVPDGAENFAFIGEFVETPNDTVFTTEFAVRTGMEAVYTLLDLDRGVPEVFASQFDMRVLMRVSHHMLDGRKLTDLALPFPERFALKQLIRKLKGTTIYDMMEENELI